MKILLGVCGSIAAYKTYDLARGLIKKGHEVRVVLTKGSLNFVQPQVYKYLGINEVYQHDDDFNYPEKEEQKGILHINLAKWAEHFLIYPASANTIANLAFGKADDLLTSIFLAKTEATITSIFPAMNTYMYTHPITQENIDLIKRIYKAQNIFIHPPAKGELACGDVGQGKAPAIDKVINCIKGINPKINSNARQVLITTGATIAPIDPVRYVTNASSGKTGYELAIEALKRGYRVKVIAGKEATSLLDDLLDLPGFELERVVTTRDMLAAVKRSINKSDIYISSAAISDIEFDSSTAKLKKDQLGDSLKYNQAPDILKTVLDNKSDNLTVVGFAAETNLAHEVLLKKWERKPVSLLVGTQVHSGLCHGEGQQGFNTDSASYKFFADGKIIHESTLNKSQLPHEIFERLQ
jgi:phosphopantothenoylcysteine decarboxylase/phosphopantothenate--cysteine ligase